MLLAGLAASAAVLRRRCSTRLCLHVLASRLPLSLAHICTANFVWCEPVAQPTCCCSALLHGFALARLVLDSPVPIRSRLETLQVQQSVVR